MGHPKLPPVGGKEIKIDHDAIKGIVKRLEKDLHELENLRYSSQIKSATPSESAVGDYKAGRGLHSTFRYARDSISETLDEFINSYRQVIKALRDSEDTHRKGDEASERAVRAAGSPNSYI